MARLKMMMVLLLLCAAGASARGPQRHEFTIQARRYAFAPPKIEVRSGDIVAITLEAEDIPHRFAIDALHICRRATPGEAVTFEFRVEERGTFHFYCSLTADLGCRNMTGELIVR